MKPLGIPNHDTKLNRLHRRLLRVESRSPGRWHVVGDDGEPAFLGGWSATAGPVPVRFRYGLNGLEIEGTPTGGTGVVFTLPAGASAPLFADPAGDRHINGAEVDGNPATWTAWAATGDVTWTPASGLPGRGGDFATRIAAIPSLDGFYGMQEASGDIHATDHTGYLEASADLMDKVTYQVDGPGGDLPFAIDFRALSTDSELGPWFSADAFPYTNEFNNRGAVHGSVTDPADYDYGGSFSGCCWVKPAPLADQDGATTFMGTRRAYYSDHYGWSFGLDGTLALSLDLQEGGTTASPITGPTALIPDTWYFAGFSWDHATMTAHLYLNGSPYYSATGTDDPGGGINFAIARQSGSYGGHEWPFYYVGAMAGMAMFHDALTDSDHANLFSGLLTGGVAGQVLTVGPGGGLEYADPYTILLNGS